MSQDGCSARQVLDYHLYVAVMVSAGIIIILLSFMQRRKNCYPNFMWGIPGIVIPVDLIGPNPFRLIYCAILGCWAADVVKNGFDYSLYYTSNYSLLDSFDFFVLSPTIIILSQALAYYPVFACVSAPIPAFSHIIGFLYTSLMIFRNIYSEYITTEGCSYHKKMSQEDIGIFIGHRIPVYFLYLIVLCWYLWRSMLNPLRIAFAGKGFTEKIPNDRTMYEQYVKYLLKRKPKAGSMSCHMIQHSLWNYLVRGLHYVIPNFYHFYYRYPLPILGSFVMSFAIITPLAVLWGGLEYHLAKHLLKHLERLEPIIHIIEELLPSTKHHLDRVFQEALSFAKAYRIILPFGSMAGLGLCWLFTLYMIQNTHKHLMKAARGDTRFLVMSQSLPSPVYRLAAIMRFTALQVGFHFFTWIVFTLVVWILLSIGLAFYYGFKNWRHFAIHFWAWFMVPMLWAAAIHNLQLFLCKYVFLERQRGALPRLRLRRLFQLLTYIFFFYNVIYGFVMCLLRVFGVGVFTVIMLFRTDWDVYMRGLEGWDVGHRTYVSYIYTEYTYHNPVLRLFVDLLLRRVKTVPTNRQRERSWSLEGDLYGAETDDVSSAPDDVSRAPDGWRRAPDGCKRAQNRWLLAFTLLRNPSLQQDRVRGQKHTNVPTTYAIN